jgi:thioredoxin 1
MVEDQMIMKTSQLVLMLALCIGSHTAFSQKQSVAPVNKKSPVTFVELGSVNCIPCRQMQPVMKAIEKKYGEQVKVVFYDVWKPEQRKYAEQYGIKLIPTQVFLDAKGKEFFRHEGFYPEADIDKLLQKQGLKIQTGS